MKSKHVTHIKDLLHDPKNARKHTPRNVGTIVSALQEVGAARSIVIDEDGVVLAGNATMDAAAEAGITAVKVVEANGNELVAVRRTGLTPEQKTRLALYDNRAAEFAEWDDEVLKQLALQEQLTGLWNEQELAALLAGDDADNPYTHKIDTPIYTVKGERPAVSVLFDDTKTRRLHAQIDQCELPEEVAQFLKSAAERHTVFHFQNIAEYYAHASPEVQALMEESALVVIDFNAAIERGFVQLTETLAAAYLEDYDDA